MKTTTLFRFLLVSRVLLAGLALSGVAAPGLYAASFIVNTTADTHDKNFATKEFDGVCDDGTRDPNRPEKIPCSLRAAIEEASNLAAPYPVVTLPSGTYGLTNGALTITGNPRTVFLEGAGSNSTIIDGGGKPYPDDSSGSQVFEISMPGGTVHIYGVTIQNGQTGGLGGGILINSGSALRFV